VNPPLRKSAGKALRPPTATLPDARGTYALVLHARRIRKIRVGRFGEVQISPGYYVYVGSAFGSGGLRARLAHHCRRTQRPHWHIDYLRAVLPLREIWFATGNKRQESLWARLLADQPGAGIPVPGFGASDRRGATHLYRFARKPSLRHFVAVLRELTADACVTGVSRGAWGMHVDYPIVPPEQGFT
jgi:Uri superfamily endonuclease